LTSSLNGNWPLFGSLNSQEIAIVYPSYWSSFYDNLNSNLKVEEIVKYINITANITN